MADQTTTIASFPGGFATIAGVIYAIVATHPKIWSHTCWSRFRGRTPRSLVHPDYRPDQVEEHFKLASALDFEGVCHASAREVTRRLQRVPRDPQQQDDGLAAQLAALHILVWARRCRSGRGRNIPTSLAPSGSAGTAQPGPEIELTVNIIDYKSNGIPHSIKMTQGKLIGCLKEAFGRDTRRFDPTLSPTIDEAMKTNLPANVYAAQAAGPWDVIMTEIGFKGIEVLFAAGIVLGSSGGAWLALTLASIFPQRVAAGLYASSFGQVLPTRELMATPTDKYEEHVFIAPGTLWVDPDSDEGYCVRPCLRRRWFDDACRNTLGYTLQYGMLYALLWYKHVVRTTLFPDTYRQTVDTVRYVVLVIEPCVLIVSLGRLVFQRKSRLLRVSLAIYLLMWSLGVVCMVFGQKQLDRVWHIPFPYIARLVDPIAAVGAVAAVYIRAKDHERGVDTGQWGLVWAMGVCSAVW